MKEKLDSETKSRITGVQKQITPFSFFFGLHLGRKLYGVTDNLSKSLQKEKMSVVSGKKLADLTIDTLQGMRNNNSFLCFYDTVKKLADKVDQINSPSLLRQRKKPKYSILNYLDGCESSHESYHPETPSDYYKQIYIEAYHAVINSYQR